MAQADHLRNVLVQDLVDRGAISSQSVRQAFEQVPRHLFVPMVDVATAYSDQPVFVRWDAEIPTSSSSQPTMMAIMVEQLDVEPGSRVLEIGAGTGYNAAILAHMVGETGSVVTVDIDQDIIDEAVGNLSKAGYDNVKCMCGDGFEGVPADLPYDRIIVTVGAQDVSPRWVHQLKDGGIMVVPLWFKGFTLSVALEKRGGELRGLSASPCTFIPIRGIWQRTEGYFPIGDPPNDSRQMAIGLDWDDQAFRRDLDCLFAQDATLREIGRSLEGQFYAQDIFSGLYISLTVDPGTFLITSLSENDLSRGFGYGLVDLDSMSAAVLSDAHPEQVMVYGKSDAAYHRLIELLDRWDRLGHPSIGDLHIRALFSAPQFIPDCHWIIDKRSDYTWILSWGH